MKERFVLNRPLNRNPNLEEANRKYFRRGHQSSSQSIVTYICRGSTFCGVGIFGEPGAAERDGVEGEALAPLGVPKFADWRLRSFAAFLPDLARLAGGEPIVRDSVQGSSKRA